MNNKDNTRERPLTQQRKQELLQRICEYVDAHLSERTTLLMVADAFGVSVSTVTQLFQHRTGSTFHRFLTGRRMAAAEQLIARGVPLEEVGRQVGYTDHSSFYRTFKQIYGVSPRDYRQGKRKM